MMKFTQKWATIRREAVIILLIALSGASITHAQWQPTNGPSITFSEDTIAPVSSMATLNGTLFVGGIHGVFKSTDTGQTWVNVLGSGYCSLTTIGTILFACTVGEIFRSTNDGQTWIQAN